MVDEEKHPPLVEAQVAGARQSTRGLGIKVDIEP